MPERKMGNSSSGFFASTTLSTQESNHSEHSDAVRPKGNNKFSPQLQRPISRKGGKRRPVDPSVSVEERLAKALQEQQRIQQNDLDQDNEGRHPSRILYQ